MQKEEGESILSLAEKRKAMEIEKAKERLVDMGGALVDEMTGCWLWKGDLDARGYARLGSEMAYRVIFAMMSDEEDDFLDGLDIDHFCSRRACFRPAHLDPVTPQENQQRKSRRPTRCPRGHFLTVESHGRTPEGGSFCRKCIDPSMLELPVMEWADKLFGT